MVDKKQVTSDQPKASRSRRSFLAVVWGGLGLAVVGEFIWIGGSFFKPRKSQNRLVAEGVIEAGMVDDFAPGSVKPFRRSGFYLSRLEDGGFLALSSRCTHLGCVVSWDPDSFRFECPCHSSIFDSRGDVMRAPAPRALDTFPVVIKNGKVVVLTGKKTKRDRFHYRQVTNV